jgi:hypothetical protein
MLKPRSASIEVRRWVAGSAAAAEDVGISSSGGQATASRGGDIVEDKIADFLRVPAAAVACLRSIQRNFYQPRA